LANFPLPLSNKPGAVVTTCCVETAVLTKVDTAVLTKVVVAYDTKVAVTVLPGAVEIVVY
jgi:hypothetical protein